MVHSTLKVFIGTLFVAVSITSTSVIFIIYCSRSNILKDTDLQKMKALFFPNLIYNAGCRFISLNNLMNKII